jgi:hypothetical protein
VRELANAGLKRWPDDPELIKLKSDAARELVTRAMAARSAGDVAGARDLVKTAQDLDTNDATAKLLLDQYDDEIDADGGALHGARVALDVPVGRARPGGRAELVARITAGNAHPRIQGAQFSVKGPGIAAGGASLPAVGDGPFRATFSPPREGTYSVQFEANVDGATVRAERTLDVVK